MGHPLEVPVKHTVGGLLAMTRDTGASTDTYLYGFDGNGNVVHLQDASDASVVAAYQYSPFGQVTSATGSMAAVNPVRWSTKPTDDETGLVNYELRDYSPRMGRWAKRDPIGERGGLNLYAFVENFEFKAFAEHTSRCTCTFYGKDNCQSFCVWREDIGSKIVWRAVFRESTTLIRMRLIELAPQLKKGPYVALIL